MSEYEKIDCKSVGSTNHRRCYDVNDCVLVYGHERIDGKSTGSMNH